jgi:hypothetical protein
MAEGQPSPEDYKARWEIGWRRGRGDAITWAFILIWAGVVFLAEHLNWVANYTWWNTWAVILGGAGVILVIRGVARLVAKDPLMRRSGSLIVGLIFIGVCLGMITSWSIIWPLVLIGVGLLIIVESLLFRRS